MKLNKKFGFWTVLASTLAAIVGSSIILSFNSVFALAGGNPTLMILAWIFGAMIVLPDALVVVEPSIAYQQNGTAYSWIKKCNWKVMGFWFGWVLILFVSATSLASCCSAMGQMVGQIAGIKSQAITNLMSTGILVGLAAIQILVKNSNKYTQVFFLVIKSLPILLVFILAIIYGSKDGLLSNSETSKSLGQAYVGSALLIPAITYTGFAYSGHEFPTYITEEIENPKKTVPLVMVGSVIIVLVIYLVYGIALLSLANENGIPKGSTSTIFANHKWAVLTFNIMAIFLFIGSVNSLLLFQSRLIHKLSETEDVHNVFGLVYEKTNQPFMAIILLSCVACFFIWAQSITSIISSFALATTCLKILLNSAVIKLRLKDPDYKRIYNNKVFWTLMIISLITCLITLIGAFYLVIIFPIQEAKATKFPEILGVIWKQLFMMFVAGGVYLFGVIYYMKLDMKKMQKQIDDLNEK